MVEVPRIPVARVPLVGEQLPRVRPLDLDALALGPDLERAASKDERVANDALRVRLEDALPIELALKELRLLLGALLVRP